MLFASSSSSLSLDRMSQGEVKRKENVRKSYNGRNTTCNERLLNEYAGFAVIRKKASENEIWKGDGDICVWVSLAEL